jgi:hypothetical protein
MKKLRNYEPFITGVIAGLLPYAFGYSIITIQWWLIAVSINFIAAGIRVSNYKNGKTS